jgi:hypothetical protein
MIFTIQRSVPGWFALFVDHLPGKPILGQSSHVEQQQDKE